MAKGKRTQDQSRPVGRRLVEGVWPEAHDKVRQIVRTKTKQGMTKVPVNRTLGGQVANTNNLNELCRVNCALLLDTFWWKTRVIHSYEHSYENKGQPVGFWSNLLQTSSDNPGLHKNLAANDKKGMIWEDICRVSDRVISRRLLDTTDGRFTQVEKHGTKTNRLLGHITGRLPCQQQARTWNDLFFLILFPVPLFFSLS